MFWVWDIINKSPRYGSDTKEKCLVGQAVKTLPSHGRISGSIPLRGTLFFKQPNPMKSVSVIDTDFFHYIGFDALRNMCYHVNDDIVMMTSLKWTFASPLYLCKKSGLKVMTNCACTEFGMTLRTKHA